nr:MAG TPA: hypothetical protein [Caudoviricetes sp.]
MVVLLPRLIVSFFLSSLISQTLFPSLFLISIGSPP